MYMHLGEKNRKIINRSVSIVEMTELLGCFI